MKRTDAVWAFLLLVLSAPAAEQAAPGPLPARVAAVRIVLPDLAYREAPLGEILEDIAAKSRAADPAGLGVNLVVKLDPRRAAVPVTLSVTAPTVERMLALLATTADLYVRYDAHTIVVEPSRRPNQTGTGRGQALQLAICGG